MRRSSSTSGFVFAFIILAMAMVWTLRPAFASPPYRYYVLAPEHLESDLAVISLEPNNTVTGALAQLSLGEYETGTIPASELSPGTIISGTAYYTVGSTGNAADLLAPDSFASTAFVIPHISGQHKYYIQATAATAHITIRLGSNIETVEVVPGTAYEIDAGSDNSIAGRINSDQPIVVSHVAYVAGVARDAYPVPPAATDIGGIRSQYVTLGASTDGTSATVYASNGTSATYTLAAGEKVAVAVGAADAQGEGSALRIVANYPVAAVQYDDGDGADATAFLPQSAWARRHGLPVSAQYVAVVCLQANVNVTLFKGSSAPESQICSGNGTSPGKAYFGLNTSGANLAAGWSIVSSEPVYLMYEASSPEDEHNLSGFQQASGPAAPTLTAISSPTTSNPVTISGTAGANATVRLFVNGRLQQTATASGAGTFSFAAELFDGNNVLHAASVSGGAESEPSSAIQVVYNNTISRTQSGTLSGNVVWTPGNPALPYNITASLTIASGSKLVLQAGTTLKFANGTMLTANGALKIAGTPGNLVTLTSSAASPTKGIWAGLRITASSAGTDINGALIDWAATGVEIDGTTATVRNSTIRNFSTAVSGSNGRGIRVRNGASSTLLWSNTISNGGSGRCIETDSASPTIQNNQLSACSAGIYVYRVSSPTIASNAIYSHSWGIYVTGNNDSNPQPVATANRIYSNTTANYFATGFTTSGYTLLLNAQGNWWGTTNAASISASINDLTDDYANTRFPSVNYANFLSAVDGSPVTGNFLIGALPASSTTLTAGTPYDVLGVVMVTSGKSLTVPAGTILRFHADKAGLVADGTLSIQGTSGNPVVLTSAKASPARGDWAGVVVRSSSTGSLIDYALIEWAVTAVKLDNAAATVRNSTLRNFSTSVTGSSGRGVWIGNGAASALVQGNTISNGGSGHCIGTDAASPTITANNLTGCGSGIHVYRASSPTITANVIQGNSWGIYVNGNSSNNPQPVATGNQIYGNSTYNYYTENFTSSGATVVLNAQNNWWGTVDVAAIANSIRDLSDSFTSANLPTVNYANFLNAPNGGAVVGNYLIGPLSAPSTTFSTGTTYQVLGMLRVASGATLNVQSGAILRFHGATARLVVDGTLSIQGSAAGPVLLTSGKGAPAAGDWPGVLIRAGATGTVIDHAVIEWAATGIEVNGASATVRNSTIRKFMSSVSGSNGRGIWVRATATGALLENNTIHNGGAGRCIEAEGASPGIQGNQLRECASGVYVSGNASPNITGNIISNNSYGIYVTGNSNPQPTANANQIVYNTQYNYYVTNYSTSGSNITLNAQGNWWASTNPKAISSTIFDLTDNSSSTSFPSVNFGSFLNGPGGTTVSGNYLIGSFPVGSTTLSAGASYDVIGILKVPTGATLTIPAGAVLKFHIPKARLLVQGTLSVQGVAGNPAVFTSGSAPPQYYDWEGILIQSSSTGTLIDHALIEWAINGVTINGAAVTVRNSTIRNFSTDVPTVRVPTTGININDGAAGTLIQNNVIMGDDSGSTDCILTDSASPAIEGNTLVDCGRGINVYRNSSPTITGNTVRSNDYGIYVDGLSSNQPQPVVNNNQIYGNGFQYYTTGFPAATGASITLNARNNWWGSADPADFGNKIHSSAPVVDYINFLDAPAGNPVAGNYVLGSLTATTTTFAANTEYVALGTIRVPTGKTLIIEQGAVLKFVQKSSELYVAGSLQIQGQSGNLARLTSARRAADKDDWRGIRVLPGAGAVTLDFAVVEYTDYAIQTEGANIIIRDSIIHAYHNFGIFLDGVTSATEIRRNLIENYTEDGTGILITDGSPIIDSNRIYRNTYGIWVEGNSQPQITANVIAYNTWGVYVEDSGSNDPNVVPRPTITGNDIFGNTWVQLEVAYYGSGNPAVINATGNYWGSANPQAGNQIRFTDAPGNVLDFSSPAANEVVGAGGIASLAISESFFSPNGDSVKESTTLSGVLSQAGNWTVTVRSLSQQPVRSYSGSGTAVSAVWDGLNGSGVMQADGKYIFEVAVSGAFGTQVVGYRDTVLDNSAPTTLIASPSNGAALVDVMGVAVIGTGSDAHLVSHTLEYGAGATPSSWTEIQTRTTNVNDEVLGAWNSSGAEGVHVIRLRATDRAGNSAQTQISVSVDNFTITAVSQNAEVIKPSQNQSLVVNFSLSKPATAYLRIYPERGGVMVKEMSETFTSAGAKSLSWDGRNSSGALVPDEAYSYVISATSGARSALYDPPLDLSFGSASGVIDSSFNAYRNDFAKVTFTLGQKSRIRLQVTPNGMNPFDHTTLAPYPQGDHVLLWDGRNPAGAIVPGTAAIYFDVPKHLKPASVIVRGGAPVIQGTGLSPDLEVKSNPWQVIHSYEQFSKFSYRVDQDSYVTIKLLPPGIYDPVSSQAILLVNNELKSALSAGQPVDHSVEWKGFLDSDTNNILVTEEGSYTFIIQATSVATGASSMYRGALQLYQ